jgi:hypothetical protein
MATRVSLGVKGLKRATVHVITVSSSWLDHEFCGELSTHTFMLYISSAEYASNLTNTIAIFQVRILGVK